MDNLTAYIFLLSIIFLIKSFFLIATNGIKFFIQKNKKERWIIVQGILIGIASIIFIITTS